MTVTFPFDADNYINAEVRDIEWRAYQFQRVGLYGGKQEYLPLSLLNAERKEQYEQELQLRVSFDIFFSDKRDQKYVGNMFITLLLRFSLRGHLSSPWSVSSECIVPVVFSMKIRVRGLDHQRTIFGKRLEFHRNTLRPTATLHSDPQCTTDNTQTRTGKSITTQII